MNAGWASEQALQSQSLAVSSQLESMQSVLSWFERFRGASLPEHIWLEGQTALVEGFTNAVRHAHRHLESPPDVEVVVELSADYFRIKVLDGGGPFDLESALQKLAEEEIAKDYDPLDREAHWGILMLMKLRRDYGWSVDYRPLEDRGNILLMSHGLANP
jgi:serine/threonine-protein kinase RsbW